MKQPVADVRRAACPGGCDVCDGGLGPCESGEMGKKEEVRRHDDGEEEMEANSQRRKDLRCGEGRKGGSGCICAPTEKCADCWWHASI